MCDRRVLCVYIEYCDILHYVFMIYVVYYSELTELGSKDPPTLWDRRVPLRHIDWRVLFEYSHERLMSYVWYFGELTKLCAYRVMCYVFQVLLRITGRRRLDCTHEKELCLRLLDYVLTIKNMCFLIN